MFEILLRYLEPLKGSSRETTVKAAEKIIEELENDESSKGIKVLRYETTCFSADAKTKAQISCSVIMQLISAFVFVTKIL